MSALILPTPLQSWVEAAARSFLQSPGAPRIDFAQPTGEVALISADSVSWHIFKNPAAVFTGGVTAVLLELAEPRVRAGVWEHTAFRADPVRRLRSTGLAAMVTVYGPRSAAEGMIAAVNRAHTAIAGYTPTGLPYRADDPELLTWVQATALYGFAQAYGRYVRPLAREEIDRFYAEGAPVARLYGALDAPTSATSMRALLAAMRPRLEASPVLPEFLSVVRDALVFPAPLGPVQRLLVRAAVDLVPGWARRRLGLAPAQGLRHWERPMVRFLGSLADRIVLRDGPAVQSCLRLGLPAYHLYHDS